MTEPEVQVKPQTKLRKASRFRWTEVSPSLVYRLLLKVYQDAGRQEEVDELLHFSEAHLYRQAEITLGEPPKAQFNRQLTDVVLDEGWLQSESAKVVKELAVIIQAAVGGEARYYDLTTKVSSVAFLTTLRRSKNLIANVRRAFLAAHKFTYEVEPKSWQRSEREGVIVLKGENEPPAFTPYRHQVEARAALDHQYAKKNNSKKGCLVVLPTGAGKTETLVEWLLNRMEESPENRVLWVSHQQELLDQSIHRFEKLARCRPTGFTRNARSIHQRASRISTLNLADLDVAAITFQGLARATSGPAGDFLNKFFERPVYVVIDEVHHAGAKAYREVTVHILSLSPQALIGLTATPAPTSMVNHYHLREMFPDIVYRASFEELMARGILSRPILSTVTTNLEVLLEEDELKIAEFGDLPPDALRKLELRIRNQLIVNSWTRQAKRWGKTLVFATRILHAEKLCDLFKVAGVDAKTLHSLSGDRSTILTWFKQADRPAVLISVGMLTEGVDLPDARTAFLARPTTSRVLLKQMIGRVLRGPKAGGEPTAELVYFDDTWTNFSDVLHPNEILPKGYKISPDPEGPGEPQLPPVILDDNDREISEDVASAIARQLKRLAELMNSTTDLAAIESNLYSTRLVGYYEMPDSVLPVFDHQKGAYADLIKMLKSGTSFKGKRLDSFFEELHPPYPPRRALSQMVEFYLEFGREPAFHDYDCLLSPETAARKLLEAGPITEMERAELIRDTWETSIARIIYPSLERFEEAVEREVREQRRTKKRINPEKLEVKPTKKRLPNIPGEERKLKPLLARVLDEAKQFLPSDKVDLFFTDIPDVRWTSKVVGSTFGHWSIKLSGRSAGKQLIRINRLLRAPTRIIPDDVICFIIYHEMLHHLLPGQGHDAEFRELEVLWPRAGGKMAFLDTLHERYNLDFKRYRR